VGTLRVFDSLSLRPGRRRANEMGISAASPDAVFIPDMSDAPATLASTACQSFEPPPSRPMGPLWGEHDCRGPAAARANPEGPAFINQLPPPNVTGVLHMGHAFNQTIMDALTRYHRMRGDNTLWLPGTDHAGIATQIVVERQLQDQGQSRHDLGRKNFVARSGSGRKSRATSSPPDAPHGRRVDWSHEYFTMDDNAMRVVTETSCSWRTGPDLSRQAPGELGPRTQDRRQRPRSGERGRRLSLVHPLSLADGSGALTVATTRPETMLGDVAVMVHPKTSATGTSWASA
jgi:valyl-tRNA synthetase